MLERSHLKSSGGNPSPAHRRRSHGATVGSHFGSRCAKLYVVAGDSAPLAFALGSPRLYQCMCQWSQRALFSLAPGHVCNDHRGTARELPARETGTPLEDRDLSWGRASDSATSYSLPPQSLSSEDGKHAECGAEMTLLQDERSDRPCRLENAPEKS
ncbi:hypothetical protein V7S43_014064 [Phytophthora oleae]|uniref:Uncharacterized protein n=1 Tax=Phytophthora oleae TaxID=2107226 RepID=A0ABD3F2N6_9STRA